MSVVQLEEIPPMIEFEVRTFEDRAATLEAGEFVGTDIDLAIISPPGSRDKIERIYSEWIRHIKSEARVGRFPTEWVPMVEKKYAAWKDGTPPPTFGTPLKDWKYTTPNLAKAFKAVHITTIEELSAANEELIGRLGMGARSLKEKAISYVNQEKIED